MSNFKLILALSFKRVSGNEAYLLFLMLALVKVTIENNFSLHSSNIQSTGIAALKESYS